MVFKRFTVTDVLGSVNRCVETLIFYSLLVLAQLVKSRSARDALRLTKLKQSPQFSLQLLYKASRAAACSVFPSTRHLACWVGPCWRRLLSFAKAPKLLAVLATNPMAFLCWIRLVYWKWTDEDPWLAVGQLAHCWPIPVPFPSWNLKPFPSPVGCSCRPVPNPKMKPGKYTVVLFRACLDLKSFWILTR